MLRVSPLSRRTLPYEGACRLGERSSNKVRGFYRAEPRRFDADIRINSLIAEFRGKSRRKHRVVID